MSDLKINKSGNIQQISHPITLSQYSHQQKPSIHGEPLSQLPSPIEPRLHSVIKNLLLKPTN